MLIYQSENPEALKKCVKSTLSRWHRLFTTWFTEYFKPTVETYCSEKKKRLLSKYYCSSTKVLDHPGALLEMYNEINVIFMPANTHSAAPMGEGIVLTLQSYLRNIFHYAAIRQC